MILNVFLKGVVISQIFIITILALKYEIVARNEQMFLPCDIEGYKFIHDFLDVSDVKYEFLTNGSLLIKGKVIIIRNLGGDNNPTSLQSFKKKRDTWVSTIYNMGHPDACKYLFSDKQTWSDILKKLPEEYRRCPFYEGQEFYLNVVTDMSVFVPDPQFAGEYKARIVVEFKEINEIFCVETFGEVYRA